jgi:hypothetical protein
MAEPLIPPDNKCPKCCWYEGADETCHKDAAIPLVTEVTTTSTSKGWDDGGQHGDTGSTKAIHVVRGVWPTVPTSGWCSHFALKYT